jgi:hypothetical protein
MHNERSYPNLIVTVRIRSNCQSGYKCVRGHCTEPSYARYNIQNGAITKLINGRDTSSSSEGIIINLHTTCKNIISTTRVCHKKFPPGNVKFLTKSHYVVYDYLSIVIQ